MSEAKMIERPMEHDYTCLLGKWFHGLDDGKVIWQGQVLEHKGSGDYLLQIHGWLKGEHNNLPSNKVTVNVKNMADWMFYDSEEDMQAAWNKGTKKEKMNTKGDER